jgi:Ras-related protein Rab-8A
MPFTLPHPQILIGNKCDMLDKKVIETARGQALADEYKMQFFETSAKNNINVEKAFFAMAREVLQRIQEQDAQLGGGGGGGGGVPLEEAPKKVGGCIC